LATPSFFLLLFFLITPLRFSLFVLNPQSSNLLSLQFLLIAVFLALHKPFIKTLRPTGWCVKAQCGRLWNHE
jgi:hypothetical protein